MTTKTHAIDPHSSTGTDRLTQLAQRLSEHPAIIPAAYQLRRGQTVGLEGVWGGAHALAAAALTHHQSHGPLVVVVPRSPQIEATVHDLTLFAHGSVWAFPAVEESRADRLLSDPNYGVRLSVLKGLVSDQVPDLIVTSIQALMQGVPDRDGLRAATRPIAVNQAIDLSGLTEWLARQGFEATSAVEAPGEFSLRGGILDIFASDWSAPVRIELFGDQVESIRHFDVATQRSLERLESIQLTAVALDVPCSACLAQWLPHAGWWYVVEPDQAWEEGCRLTERAESSRLENHLSDVWARLSSGSAVFAAHLLSNPPAATHRISFESVDRFHGDAEQIRLELDRVPQGDCVYVVGETDAELKRLRELFGATAVGARGDLCLVMGQLDSGFRAAELGAIVLSAHQMFGRLAVRRPVRRHTGKPIDSFLDLRPGDLVVHIAHGIARYRGLQVLEKDGQVEEHLELEFDGKTKVYVPAGRIDLVQKYVGGRTSRPRLARLGSKAWVRQKQAAAVAVTDLAAEMLQLQAERLARPGISMNQDTYWQHQFDAAFLYQETPDQLLAIEVIKLDMQTPKPMDRLLCGDVGFGKTELAMRAAFKAVDNGYQVALMAPTTILVEQHFRTFCDRMSEFPFQIAKLSRFCSRAEQRHVVEGLASGQIDIVIGTHRLASQDVQFRNLGLLIIDEEQRFGVEVKDRLKMLRTSVDVLTLSATPIPRTLHMALVGIRDICNLETPPEDRLAVETRLTRSSDQLIRHAILREMNRGGQVYFVHNRVEDIDAIARRLRRLVPEASLAIGHGQMHESELEQVMVDFVAGRNDILLATTIVENGLDIPNANTIFIDEADRYGLADLHQLRGRVGRYKHHAYCYLLIDPHKAISPNAARRLRAIEEYSHMGAGFAIAMQDLEIRGAGNLLGTQQSGHIALVGYELYCQLLEAAVRHLKRLPSPVRMEVSIELPGESYLPDDYVPDMRSKIDLYRRLAQASSYQAIRDLEHEMLDRFGSLPPPAHEMLKRAQLKLDAARWQIDSIHRQRAYLVFGYTDRCRAEQLVEQSGGRLRRVDDRNLYLTLPSHSTSPDQILAAAKSVLQAE